MKTITVSAICGNGWECEPEEFTIHVPDDWTDRQIQEEAEKEAISYLRVDWRDATPKPPPCQHAAVRQERTLRDDAAKIEVCSCGYWKYLGERGGWVPPPFPVERVIQ